MDQRYYDPQRVKEARLSKGLTQGEVARALKVDRTTIVRAESGRASYRLLCALAAYFHVRVSRFVYEVPKS